MAKVAFSLPKCNLSCRGGSYGGHDASHCVQISVWLLIVTRKLDSCCLVDKVPFCLLRVQLIQNIHQTIYRTYMGAHA